MEKLQNTGNLLPGFVADFLLVVLRIGAMKVVIVLSQQIIIIVIANNVCFVGHNIVKTIFLIVIAMSYFFSTPTSKIFYFII